MSALPTIQAHPSSIDAYIRHGWSLVPIPAGTKGPRTDGWNIEVNALKSHVELPQGHGIGLAHAYSGTMALDIDNWDMTAMVLGLQGIDIQALYDANDAVVIDSGKQGHGKLLYAMPEGVRLRSKKIITSGQTTYELRCGTANNLTVQDVLPPSTHPGTMQPYRWAGKGHWTRLPSIPAALLTLWQGMLDKDSARVISSGDSVDASWDDIRSAVGCIDPNCTRDEWVSVGMALKWASEQTQQAEQGLHVWHEWSVLSTSKYPGDRELSAQWHSFKNDKPNAIKLGSLFHIAREHGWVRPMPNVTSLFTAVHVNTTPQDLLEGLRPAPPDMDTSLFPSILQKRASEISESVGCDPLVPLFAGLSAICGVVDAQMRLELMPGFLVPPVLWLMTLGDPADKKSPGSRPMLSPLKNIEAEDRPRYQKELLDWEGKEAAYASAKKTFLDFAASPEAMLGGNVPHVPEMPPKPVPVKITVSDITSQKLVRHASERPRGLLCHLDEMNSWIRKLTDKTSGEDRSAWVVSYESERYEMDRVGAGSIHCDNLAVSIYGNIQPAVFRQNVASLAADGLLQRFIPAILRANKTRLGHPIPEYLTSAAAWENTLRLTFALPAQTYKLSTEAFTAYREFQSWYEVTKRDERLLQSGDVFMTAFGKIEGTVGRMALVFHIIENPFNPTVSVEVIHRVVRFIKSYLIPAYRYAFSELGAATLFESWLSDHIIHYSDRTTITLSDVRRAGRAHLDGLNSWVQDEWIYAAMRTLEVIKWVARMDDGSGETRHYAEWAVNPGIKNQFESYRKKVVVAKDRQLAALYEHRKTERPRAYGASDYDNDDN